MSSRYKTVTALQDAVKKHKLRRTFLQMSTMELQALADESVGITYQLAESVLKSRNVMMVSTATSGISEQQQIEG